MFGPEPIPTQRGGAMSRRCFYERKEIMAEYTNTLVQQVAAGQNVVFINTPVRGSACIVHREGSGIVTLRGMTNQCRALYKVTFGGNLSIPTGGTVGPISIAISVQGEALGSSIATVTPAAVGNEFNVFSAAFVEVPRGCCVTVAVSNVTAAQAIEVQNANLIIERVA